MMHNKKTNNINTQRWVMQDKEQRVAMQGKNQVTYKSKARSKQQQKRGEEQI